MADRDKAQPSTTAEGEIQMSDGVEGGGGEARRR